MVCDVFNFHGLAAATCAPLLMSVQDGHRQCWDCHVLFAHSRGGSLGVRPGRTVDEQALTGARASAAAAVCVRPGRTFLAHVGTSGIECIYTHRGQKIVLETKAQLLGGT